jgi:hypothetical protein
MVSAVIEPATFDDVRAIKIPEQFQMVAPEVQFESEQWLSEHARVVRKDGVTIAVFGVKPLWKGVGHVFGYVTADAKQYPKTLVCCGRAIMEEGCSPERGFWRLQATVESNFNRGIRYLMLLGFTIDGLLKRFGPDGNDHLMMSRLL